MYLFGSISCPPPGWVKKTLKTPGSGGNGATVSCQDGMAAQQLAGQGDGVEGVQEEAVAPAKAWGNRAEGLEWLRRQDPGPQLQRGAEHLMPGTGHFTKAWQDCFQGPAEDREEAVESYLSLGARTRELSFGQPWSTRQPCSGKLQPDLCSGSLRLPPPKTPRSLHPPFLCK